jgi:hypothetical protein
MRGKKAGKRPEQAKNAKLKNTMKSLKEAKEPKISSKKHKARFYGEK